MISGLKSKIIELHQQPMNRIGTRILQIVIGVALLYRVLTEFPYASYLWGPNSTAAGKALPYFGSFIGGLIDNLLAKDFGIFVILAILSIGCLGLLFGFKPRLATLFTLVGYWILEIRNPALGDGGDNITRIILVYMLFLLPGLKPIKPGLRVWLHNLAVAAITLQVIIVYSIAGTSKFMGELWTNGTALYYISQVEWFSTAFYANLFKNLWLTQLATYSTMFYQAAFPFLIFTRYRLLIFAVGILFHLGILVMMGLVVFSTIMIGLELFLINDKEYQDITKKLKIIWFWILSKLSRQKMITKKQDI